MGDVEDDEQTYGNAEHAVCNVKSRPVVISDVEIQEISDATIVKDSVVKVSDYACGEHCKSDLH